MGKARNSIDNYNKVFATRLREIMDENEITQETLAKETGMTRQSISTYMDGSVSPNTEKLTTICRHFNVPSDYLLGLTNSKSADVTNQHITDKIGLSDKAIKTLENLNTGSLEPFPWIAIIDYMFSNGKFISGFLFHLRGFLCIRQEDDDGFNMSPLPEGQEADVEKYLLTKEVERFADDCHNELFKAKTVKQKPGRKRLNNLSNEKD